MDEKRFLKVMWGVKALLVVVVVYVVGQTVLSRVHLGRGLPQAASGEEQPADEPAAAAETHTPSDYSAIVQRNLFTGTDRTAILAHPNRSEKLDAMPSAEELGLRLIGTVAGGPAASVAIIQNTKSNAADTYRVGEVIASATIEAIERDAVILRCQGRQLVLRLRPGVASEGKGSTDKKQEALSPAPATPAKGAAAPLSTQGRYLEEVFHKITIEPSGKSTPTQGLKISGLEKVPLAEMFGLKNGDVLQVINGQQLTSKQKAFQVLMKAKSQSRVEIQLLRDGKSKNLSFEI